MIASSAHVDPPVRQIAACRRFVLGSDFAATARACVLGFGLLAAACGGRGGGSSGPTPPVGGGQPELQRVEYGRLVDVFGVQDGLPVSYRRDVVIGGNIADERPAGSPLADGDILYDFFGTDPDTLQPRLLITRPLGSREFDDAFAALDDDLREVAPMVAGPASSGLPFSVVPRNAAIRLTFSSAVGVGDGFFVERNAAGQVTGLRNTEAVQLLRLVPDPAQPGGLAFAPLPVRIAVSANTLVLDPVLLGTEGLQYQTSNNPAGLPAAADSVGANLRIALALEGPLAIPSLREPANGLVGLNNSSRRAVVRDFRSGNSNDISSDLARGFIRDALPLRLLGEIPMYLERVEVISEQVLEITVFKNIDTSVVLPAGHEIDRGDVFRFISDSSGTAFGSGEVVVDPEDDRGQPLVQHVRVRIRRVPGLETIDPRNLSGYPSDLTAREPWLVANAPRAICVCEFTAGGEGDQRRDDPRNFLTFSPQPLPLNGVRPAANEFVSPFAAAIVRFTKPVDLSSVKPADTLFFGMRDLTSAAAVEQFRTQQGIAPAPVFNEAKYRTPFLIAARVSDQDGSQTSLRLQPSSGLYLDNTMRLAPDPELFQYFLHLVSQSPDGGVRDLAGNALDLQGTTAASSRAVVVPFTVDTRLIGGGPLVPDNLAVSVVRRFADRDEDAQPSYFRNTGATSEVQRESGTPEQLVANARTFPLDDLFGGAVYVDGKLSGRSVTRSRLVVDNFNQQPVVQAVQAPAPNPPNGPLPLAWCPQQFNGQRQITTQSAGTVFGGGLQNPLNPFGCRLQTVWREVDLSLSRTDPSDFNLDVEQMYWAPQVAGELTFDEFDSVRLTLGHSEFRPIPCVGAQTALPSFPSSGLQREFERNFLWNPSFPGGPAASGSATTAPRTIAYGAGSAPTPMTIDPSAAVREPTGRNSYLPLPRFNRPYFVFRDERVVEQGGRGSLSGSDQNANQYPPHVVSPYAMGQGRRWLDRNPNTVGPDTVFCDPFWNDGFNINLAGGSADEFTGGLTGAIAMPLLADFWTTCDSAALPAGAGYVALGFNGWQVSPTNGSGAQPNFRVLSGGRAALPTGGDPVCRENGQEEWARAAGGFLTGTNNPSPVEGGDNTLYWVMVDVLRRQSVLTNGFLDLNNPHRVPDNYAADPRLGPFFQTATGVSTLPADVRPNFVYEFDPPLSQLPAGTSVVPQFRGAGVVDPSPWYWAAWMQSGAGNLLFPAFTAGPPVGGYSPAMRIQLQPTAVNFPLDPYKAGDAHIRKWDTRPIPGAATARNWWTYLYNRTVTRYVEDPNDLVDPQFTAQFAGPNESFTPQDVRYVNWRFLLSNNPDANPPVSPLIETFSLSYRFERRPQ